jgi:iron complex outermembrane receptor protein
MIQSHSRIRRSNFGVRLMAGASLAVMAALPAFAQTAPAPVTEIVITGTSIRGVAPVGATVQAVGPADIARTADQTVQQVLQNVPAVVGLQSAGQGAFGSADGAGVDAPTIHGLGGSASNQTLIIMDGHRMPESGLNHELVDPNSIPTLALQRVEVLADGASSIYGSDAVAGVINFITRKSYNGFEAQGQAGYGDNYHTYSGGFIGGTSWDTGSAWVAYNYDYRSDLLAANRSFTHENHLSQGGSDLASYNCGVANVKIGSTFYPSPYSSANTLPATGAGNCDYTGSADLLPSESRHSLMARLTQDIGDRLTLSADTLYSNLYEVTQNVRGTASTTIYSSGPQANPYFVTPAGLATPASETVYWDGDALLGPGAHTNVSDETFQEHVKGAYKLFGDWEAIGEGTVGEVTSRQQIIGALNGSAVNLALNGTTNSAGNLTTPSVPGTSIIVTQALNGATALDPFLIGGNPTPASVLAGITNSTQTRLTRHDMEDGTLKFDGSLFQLPAGAVRLAVGGEFTHYTLHLDITQPLGIGPVGDSTTNLDYARTVESGFAELLVPIVGVSQNVPLVRKLDLSLSGRIDHYSDFGNTTNPKVGADWEVVSGFKVHGAYATSFTAPALTSVGQPVGNFGVTGETGFGAYGLGAVNVPVAANALLAQLPGCSTSTTCQLGSSTVNGLQISGGNRYLVPQTGKSWSIGADYAPQFIHGLKVSATFWDNEITGGVTSPTPSVAVNSVALLNKVLTIYPNGATPAQIAAATAGLPQTSALPSTVYFIYNYQQQNILDMSLQGIDFQVSYDFDTDYGHFTVQTAGSYETKFQEQIGAGTPWYSVLNTTGANTTFPSIQFQGRSGLAWTSKVGVSIDLFWNHTSAYHNWSGTTVTPIQRNSAGFPIGGGDTVAANDTFDGHIAYDFQGKNSWTSGVQVYLDVQNMFDKAPPFYNTGSYPGAGAVVTSGYDSYAGNPIGRVISIGAHKKF